MNLLNYFKQNIHMNKIESFKGDLKELSIVRYVMKEASKIFYRDYTFFLYKENLKDREQIYNKEIDLKDTSDFSIVCKSYCNVIKEILKQNYDIDSELISAFNDKFRHYDLLIKTKTGKVYIVDPLMDMIEMKVGMRTNNFASKEYYDSMYVGKIENVSFLNNKELEEIDDAIDYKKGKVYLDDFLEFLKNKFTNIEEMLQENESISTELLGKKYNNEKLSDDQKTELKLRFISKYLNNRKYINGTVELLIFSNIVIKKIFSKEEQKKLHPYSFFVDTKDLKNEDLKEILTNKEDRKRGIAISFNGKIYIFSLNDKTLQYSDEQWENIIRENNIIIKPQYHVKLLKFLKNNGVDRNILHNNEFLKLFNKFENCLLNNGKTLEEIIENNIWIQDGIIYTKLKDDYISYKIENGNLAIKQYNKNKKNIVLFEDEGRNVIYQTEDILKDNEKLLLYEFDSNGLFDLEDVEGIENLVEPLKNGKYLSRNSSYYESKTYSELALERSKLKEILTDDVSKKNFVILEYLANASAKVYFEELKKKINNQDNFLNDVQKCLEEDCTNIVRFFRNEPILKPVYDLPEGKDKVLERYIEMDNKQMLYMFCSNLKFTKPKHVLTPGLGSILVGPILKSMYGFDYTNILYSLYCKDEDLKKISAEKSFDDICSNNSWEDTENELILIDDNVGSCNTMNTIRKKLKERDKNCRYGAVKYNWDFYKQVKHKELEHPTFDIQDVDFLTILDDLGYWIMRDSIGALKEMNGDAYVEVMKQYGLRQDKYPDIQILMQHAERKLQCVDVNLYDKESRKIKKTSAVLCISLREQILEIIREFKSKNLEER